MRHRPATGWSRRGLVASLFVLARPAARAQKGKTLASEVVRYLDPATEFPVERLTDPRFPSLWPYPYNRALAKGGVSFFFSSDRGDGMQVFRYELKSGQMRQLTEAQGLAPETVTLLPDDRALAYVAGRSVWVAAAGGSREREIYRIPDGWELGEGFSVALDGIYACLVERQTGGGKASRLRLIGMARGDARTLVEHTGTLRHPQPRPRRASVLYLQDDELHLVGYDGAGAARKLGASCLTTPGAAFWQPDGRTVYYLAENEKRTVWIREVTPDTGQDRPFAMTSQFGNFSRNTDGSVILAALRSVAQPHIVLMLRSVKRELTLCEHKASDALRVTPVFSPTSQRIYFVSDQHGKPAVYSVVVDKFIEKTEDKPSEKTES